MRDYNGLGGTARSKATLPFALCGAFGKATGALEGTRGAGMRNYGTFLRSLGEELFMAIAEAENAGWHHEEDTEGAQVYARLLTWSDEIHARLDVWDHRG